MPVQVLVTAEPFGVLVAAHGVPDAAAIAQAAEDAAALSPEAGRLVVDLREAALVPAGPVLGLVGALRLRNPGVPIALVCDRLSGRRLLRSRCRHLHVAVMDALPPSLAAYG